MKTTIDAAGRLVIPKPVRQKAGVKPGMELDVDYRDGAIEVTFPPAKGKLVRKAGLLVWRPALGTPPVRMEEINEAIRLSREEQEKF